MAIEPMTVSWAAHPEPEPRLDVVPGLARARAALHRQERQGIALDPRALGEPEEDEREERCQRDGRLGDRDAGLDDLPDVRWTKFQLPSRRVDE